MAQRPRASERCRLLALVLAAVFALHCGPAEHARDQPNVVLIVADDLGYGDLGFQGAPATWSPNIDALAAAGTVFSDAYVAAPVCAPSRAALMTGRHPARYGYLNVTGTIERQIEKDIGVDPREIFLTELMRDAGYETAVIGKWHLGYNDKYRPRRRGVDYFFGFLAGGHDYFLWDDPSRLRSGGPILRNEEKVEGEGYLTEAFTGEAVRFIEKSRSKPFFLYLAYQNPHEPRKVPKRYLPPDGDVRVGMIRALDAGVGGVLRALDETGLARDTIVVFLNDNGARDNGPLRGNKGTLFEGGIRVAMVIRWPGHVAADRVYREPVSAMDLLPTLVAAAGGRLPRDRTYDGVDLLPYLDGRREGPPHDTLFWRFFGRGEALRKGSLKLHRKGASRWLYDLSRDPGEEHDLSLEQPDALAELGASLDAWREELARPDPRPQGKSAQPEPR